MASRLQERSGTLQALHLERIAAPPESLLTLLRWPADLRELHLTSMGQSGAGRLYNLDNVQSIFDVHKTTLCRARVGIMPPRYSGPPSLHSAIDVSTYPELRHLTLSTHGLFNQAPNVIAKRLSGPRLRQIVFNFSPEEFLMHEGFEDFDEEKAEWMKKFVVALRGQSQPDAELPEKEEEEEEEEEEAVGLPTIHLEFNPAHSPREGPDSWPWDYIDPLKIFALEKGTTITSREYDPALSEPPIHFPLRILRPQFRLHCGQSTASKDDA